MATYRDEIIDTLGCMKADKIGNVYEYAAGQWALKGEWGHDPRGAEAGCVLAWL